MDTLQRTVSMASRSERDPRDHGVITCTAGVCGGEPCIAGTRLGAAAIARYDREYVRQNWPYVTDADFQACHEWYRGQTLQSIHLDLRNMEGLYPDDATDHPALRDAYRRIVTLCQAGLVELKALERSNV